MVAHLHEDACLHCSEKTACVLCGLIPIFCGFYSQFGQAFIQNFNCLLIDKEEIYILFPMWEVTSTQTGQTVKLHEAIYSHDGVRQPCL